MSDITFYEKPMTDNNKTDDAEDNNTVHNIHDKHLFNVLKDKAVAKDMCLAYWPEVLRENAIFEDMHLYQTKKISPQFKEFAADILYRVPLKSGNKAMAFFHIEHQSQPKKNMPLRMWQYLLLILDEYHQNHPNKPLPIIYPCIFYTGSQPYKYSTNLFDLFGENKETVKSWITDDIKLIDVCRLSDEEIKQHRLFGLAEFVLKHRFTMAFKEILLEIFPWMKKHLEAGETSTTYTNDVLNYVLETVPDSDPKTFDETVKVFFSGPLGDEIMTAAQQLRQEGMQQGLHYAAQNMLKRGVDPRVVAEDTGLKGY